MANVWGNRCKVSIFGESHGPGLGVVIDGLPAGQTLDMEAVRAEMARRAPGTSAFATPRREADEVEILSGLFEGKTTGAPLCGIIRNHNTRSQDYEKDLPRPGHADYTAFVKYGGFADYRGGGHFSGRITAPLTFAGAVAKQFLSAAGVTVGAHIASIADVQDARFGTEIDPHMLLRLGASAFPVLDEEKAPLMQARIQQARQSADSVGGVIECAACGLPAGTGSPFFESLESRLSSMLFSVPAVKGIEFGDGFALTQLRGSEANDAFYIKEGGVATKTNHNGGINGGISNGMPLVLRVAVKPTPSIAKEQDTVDLATMTQAKLTVHGRHDPCIVVRAVPVIEAAVAIVLLDALL
ncbi:MAG: chorismate synthase [Oscillospiraceae bacterium]|nr:chorismate synthase [Oscillospiraceae bacterium]